MRRRMTLGAAVALAACAAGCANSHGAFDAGPDADIFIPVGVETVAATSVRAGQPMMVSCLLIDQHGDTHAAPAEETPALRFVPEASVLTEDGMSIPTRAGALEVACTFPGLGLIDESPAIVEVVPGDAAVTVARIEPDSIMAGDSFTTTCEVWDAYGNRVEGESPVMRAEPSQDANTFDGTTGTFERAGRFDVFCDVSGAESRGAELEVRPGLPASLVISKIPDRPFYGVGEVVDIARIVTDRFGNVVQEAEVPIVSLPFAPELGEGRFRFDAEGLYLLTAHVELPTLDNIPIIATTTVLVNSTGPKITCDSPLDGGIVDLAPGSNVAFRGTVSDSSGVRSMTVNGATVAFDSGGAFAVPIATRYGINFVDIEATDVSGIRTSRTCAFLVADNWAPDNQTLSDTVTLRLRQAAFDDSVRGGEINSLADILATVLNSAGLRTTLHNSLLASNPLKPSACDSSVLGVCVLRSEVIYLDSQVNGPNTVTLTLVDGGIRANVRVQDLRARIRVRGHVAGIPYDTTGWVTFTSVDIGAIFDTALASGRPRMNIRSGSVTASVGQINTNFSGLDGAIIDIVVGLFQGTVRDLIRNLVRDYITSNFDRVLDDVLGGLDIESLGTSFSVPRIDGAGNVDVTFGISFSSLTTSASRMLFGIGTRLYAQAAHARPTLGAPVQVGARRLDAGGSGTTAVAMHEAVLSQAVHALWRGGFFDANLNASTVSGLPAGLDATLVTGLPPVVLLRGSDQRVELSLGAVAMQLTYIDFFGATPVNIVLGVRASVAASLVGEDLNFTDFRVEELVFSTDAASLDQATRDTLEGFLRRMLERVMLSALDGALPAIPIPSFEMPASLGTYGIPVGAELGITSPTLSREAPHFVLRGGFAVR